MPDGDTGQSAVAADAHARVGQELRARAHVRRAAVTLRVLAATQPDLCFDPANPSTTDTTIRVWLTSDTLRETFTALRAWTTHIADAGLRLDHPGTHSGPMLRLAGHFHEASISVIGELHTSQPAVAEFLTQHPASDDGTVLPLELLTAP